MFHSFLLPIEVWGQKLVPTLTFSHLTNWRSSSCTFFAFPPQSQSRNRWRVRMRPSPKMQSAAFFKQFFSTAQGIQVEFWKLRECASFLNWQTKSQSSRFLTSPRYDAINQTQKSFILPLAAQQNFDIFIRYRTSQERSLSN